jgi:Apea-like HEPN
MEFLLTKFICPLEESIVLSAHLQYGFDNPRTDDEIRSVAEFLTRCHLEQASGRDAEFSDLLISFDEERLFKYRDLYSPNSSHIESVFAGYRRESIFDFIASISIIVRFDDGGAGAEIRRLSQQMHEEGNPGIFLLEDDDPLVVGFRNIANYCYLLSLIGYTGCDEYFGVTFLFSSTRLHDAIPTRRALDMPHYISKQEFYDLPTLGEYGDCESSFVPSQLIAVAGKLDHILDRCGADKFLHIGRVLRIVSEDLSDVRVKLLLLTSIVEMLVTHSPDNSRFNVEDSISKQFQLKTSVLVYLNNRNQDINTIKKRLKTIYSQRSNVAHGNFKEYEKYREKLSKKEGEEEYEDDLVCDLYTYVRAILDEYMVDPDFVEFLKDS